MSKDSNPNTNLETLHTYSRAQALEDGQLVDVTEAAREVGFTMPVALTAIAFGSYVTTPERVSGQDEAGRLWDILLTLWFVIKTSPATSSQLEFELLVRNSDKYPARTVTLKAICGPGDTLEPVLTVMMLDED